jgi:hypothetical protein
MDLLQDGAVRMALERFENGFEKIHGWDQA